MQNRKFELKGKKAEKVTHDLAVKTFLTDWCYLNPEWKRGKELCDLLVVFDDIAIIWQIKDLKLDKKGRYSKREVQKNLNQLAGAKRRLIEIKTPIELDNPRRGKEKFDPTILKEVYLVSALLGKGEDYFSGIEEVRRQFAHIFTRDFIEIVLNELDTIEDFIGYLQAKEAFFKKDKKLIILGGEEELLAFYLMNNRSFKRFDKADEILIERGSWKHLQNKPEYRAKKKEDEISYGWDSIINRAHESKSKEYELVARELARSDRFERRYLSKAFFDVHVLAHKDKSHNLFRRIVLGNKATYCFLFMDDPEPREKRKAMLFAICWIARGLVKKHKKVIGIATEKKLRPECSYDYCLLNMPRWTKANQKRMKKLQRETGIFLSPTVSRIHEDEYPIPRKKG